MNRQKKITFHVIGLCVGSRSCTDDIFIALQKTNKALEYNRTERGGSVVTHETRILEVPGSNPGADQPGRGFFVVFLSHQGKCWVGFSLP